MWRFSKGSELLSRQPRFLPLGVAALLSAGIAFGTRAQSVTFDGDTFVNKGLVAVARLASDAKDKQGDTLGGIGSGMAPDLASWRRDGDVYHGTLYMLPDRGWNTEGTVDFQGRLQVFDVELAPNDTAEGPKKQTGLGLTYKDSILMHEADGTPTTGLDASGVRKAANGLPDLPVANGRITLDNEGVVHMADGSFWVSDEYGPYIYHYAPDGKMLAVIRPPTAFIPMRKGEENFASNNPPKGGAAPSPENPESGRQNNQGFEGLAVGPDGKHLYALLQSATIQDGGKGGSSPTRFNTRMLAYDISDPAAPKLTGEYVVQLPRFKDAKGKTLVAAQSELLALNDKQFLLIARDSGRGFAAKDPTSLYRSVDLISIAKATNIAGTAFDGTTPMAPKGELDPSVTPAEYTRFIDINDNAQLNRFGLHNGAPGDANDLYEKWESMALLPVNDPATPNDYFLFVGSDNDFITQHGVVQGKPYADSTGKDVDTLVLVYRVTLPSYVPPAKTQ
ncbi:MAG TPA: esterase-like activity of phytase family protein [Dongiaceae bacterium]|nr:esterase-like activity of phytase family protein [Dongiaceae bacterium]